MHNHSNSQSAKSCHFLQFWHCRKTRGWGWPAGAVVPTRPVEAHAQGRITSAFKHLQWTTFKHCESTGSVIHRAARPKPARADEAKSVLLQSSLCRAEMPQLFIRSLSFTRNTEHNVIFARGIQYTDGAKANRLMEHAKPQKHVACGVSDIHGRGLLQ